MSPKVFEKIRIMMNLPDNADDLDLLIAITKLVEQQQKPKLPLHETLIRDAGPRASHKPNYDVPA
jgi:hypothetical protein